MLVGWRAAMPSKDVVCLRHSARMPRLMGNSGYCFRNCGDIWLSDTSRSGSGRLGLRSRTPFTIEKIAVLAPIPTARLSTTIAANARSCQRDRKAYRRSLRIGSLLLYGEMVTLVPGE